MKLLAAPRHPIPADVALLLLRVPVGVAFMIHGWGKIQHPTAWMGSDPFAPPWLQGLAALSEFGGGLAWILGLLTPLASFGIGSTMGVATWVMAVKHQAPFVSPTGGASFELPAAYLAVAVVLLILGPGRLSLDARLFGSR